MSPEKYFTEEQKDMMVAAIKEAEKNTADMATQIMIEALNNQLLAGAFLDVTEDEPLPENHVLRSMKNVVLSPHAAWYSEDAYNEIREKAVMNIIEYSKGQVPTYALNLK